MKVYLVKRIIGFYVGHFREPTWTDRPPKIVATQHAPIIGIEPEILQAYYEYLHRLGQWTFGYEYIPLAATGAGSAGLTFFADTLLNRLWPKWGRRWSPVGAEPNAWGWRQVMWQKVEPRMHWVDRRPGLYDMMFRYREKLWWARQVPGAPEEIGLFELGPDIGYPLMFERRGPGVAKKNEDEWNFGMCWWEAFGKRWDYDMFVWHSAEVRYLGFGTRVSARLWRLKKISS